MTLPTIFVSYSHKDAHLKNEFVSALQKQDYSGELDIWDDTRLRGGDQWRCKIDEAIGAAKVAVLLVSENFMNSSFIREEEVPKIFQARIGTGTKIVPVNLTKLKETPDWLGALERLPAGGGALRDDPAKIVHAAIDVVNLTRMDALDYLPFPGTLVPRSYSYAPVSMLGMKVDRENPFVVKFMVDPGDAGPDSRAFLPEAERLIRYFLVGLSVPESDIWVNLSPQERSRVISPGLARTELGRDLLAQDYLLKQFNASAIHPECQTGQRYWKLVHERARQHGDDVAANAFSRVWIVPDVAEVIEHDNTVVVSEAALGVELRSDDVSGDAYSHSSKFGTTGLSRDVQKDIRDWGTRVFADVLLPELLAELNEGRHFAITRQAFGALILARWFKTKINDSALARTARMETIPGIVLDDDFARAVFRQYASAFELGVVNLVHEDYDETTGAVIPRRYFSGGFVLAALRDLLSVEVSPAAGGRRLIPANRRPFWLETEFVAVNGSAGTSSVLDNGLDPGGIDLDLSVAGRMRTIRADDQADFAFDSSAAAELARRRGLAIVPHVRSVQPVVGVE